jgi:hypothetical protein
MQSNSFIITRVYAEILLEISCERLLMKQMAVRAKVGTLLGGIKINNYNTNSIYTSFFQNHLTYDTLEQTIRKSVAVECRVNKLRVKLVLAVLIKLIFR